MRNEWTIICEGTSFDQMTHRPSLFNCISDGTLGKLPGDMPAVHVVSSWIFEEKGEYEFSMVLTLPDGTEQPVGKPVKRTLPAGSAFLDMREVVLHIRQYGLHLLRVTCRRGKETSPALAARFLIAAPAPNPAETPSSTAGRAPSTGTAAKPAPKPPKHE